MNTLNSTRTGQYTYDALNRITSGQSSGSGSTSWGENFSVDAWGNLTGRTPITGKANYQPLSVTAGANNQLSGFGYDPAGNMASNSAIGASYVYDAENQLIATGGYSYIYDGDGQRVEKCTESTPGTCASGATGTLYWRGTNSDPLTETDLSGNVLNTYVFFNGYRVARRDSTGVDHYYFSDHLGSHGVIENATGAACEQDIDYYPYGGVENEYCATPVGQNYKFTSKERDAESGLDNFEARYFTSNIGRFMTPDWAARPTAVPYAVFGDPQSLNLYTYVRNDPVSRADADGHDDDKPSKNESQTSGCADGPGGSCAVEAQSSLGDSAQNASTMPLAPPAPIVLPALGEAAKDLIGGIIDTLATPLVVASYLISPGTTATEDKDTIHAPIQQSGPKAADAPGVTAGGQATDAHGNKLGPSGETQIDRTRSNTREGARNRALGEGSGAVEHSNPRVGRPHWHPTDSEGNKKPSSTHHEYPE